MIYKLLLCAGALLVHFSAYCQPDYNRFTTDYTPMESRGTIPVEFITPIKNRVNEANQAIDNNKCDRRLTRRDKKDFLLESNNQLDQYLKSGKVIFNDEVNEYVNKVALGILSGHAYAKGVRFYVIKYDYANAFTFNEGVIFINVGLIARCNNEAELASVLGHEYAHYINRHSINYNTEVKKAQRREGTYRRISLDDRKALMSRYSKDNETEADLYGYNLLKASRYNHYATVTSLEGLEWSNAVPVLCAFDKHLLEKGTLRIPKLYLYENKKDTTIDPFKKTYEDEESGEDELSTHPSIKARVQAVLKEFDARDTSGKQFFVQSPQEFNYIRTICRFELCRLYLLRNDLDRAFCLTSCLLQQYPDNVYLNRAMATILYRLARFANDKKIKDYVTMVERADAEMKATNYLLRRFAPEELNLVALRYAWYVNKKFPGYADVKEVTNRMLHIYTDNYKFSLRQFADLSKFNDTIVDYVYELKNAPLPEEYTRSGKKKKTIYRKNGYKFEQSLAYYALADLKNDPDFIAAFEASARNAQLDGDSKAAAPEHEDENTEEPLTRTADSKQSISKWGRKKSKGAEKAAYDGIGSIILVEPEFELSDQRKRIEKNYIVNEEEEAQIRNAIMECASKAGFGVTLLNANSIGPEETQKFNDYCYLKEFVVECFNQGEDPGIPTDYNRLKEISKRYNTRYAAILINKSLIYRRGFVEYILPFYLSAINPIIAIPWLATKFSPHKEYVYIIGVMDLEENKIVYGDVLSFNRKERADLFKSQFYASLITLKGLKR